MASLEPMNTVGSNGYKIILPIVFLVGLFLFNLVMSQSVMTLNLAIRDTQEHIQASQNQTRQLKVKAARFTSSRYLLKKIKSLGFVQTSSVVYLPSFGILAKND